MREGLRSVHLAMQIGGGGVQAYGLPIRSAGTYVIFIHGAWPWETDREVNCMLEQTRLSICSKV